MLTKSVKKVKKPTRSVVKSSNLNESSNDDEQSSSSSFSLFSSPSDDDDDVLENESDIDLNDDLELVSESIKRPKKMTAKRTVKNSQNAARFVKDDGNEDHFKKRISELEVEEQLKLAVDKQFHKLRNGAVIAEHVWNRLYKYQKTGVRWLHELNDQYVGGILADEMGLGKTIQICVFLRSCSESQIESHIFGYKGLGPCLIVCPATLMHQWVKELNKWFPLCKVIVFHASGSYSGPKKRLILRMNTLTKNGSVLVTSYSTYMIEYKEILKVNWHYVILDEGHKIRNPEAKITMTLKELKTPHRIILTGAPMQNNLRELWSLIDFVYPGMLGSLKEFIEKFSIPITQGGYANATSVQVRTAYRCACVLRDAIAPYMLRRMKKDVEATINLPDKNEQILFCDITQEQRTLYEEYLSSKECGRILGGKMDAFVGLITLRKLCNHPDLVNGGPNKHNDQDIEANPDLEFGACCRSGKMLVLQSLLRLWHQQKQKVLLFLQSRQMLTIIEKFVLLEGFTYLRMDGTTLIGKRQDLVDKFNLDEKIFVFLLTTRVGGLGVNLTSANRVVIFDPDWNPSTDAQARERAWRIGQTRSVTVYRLLTSGTIEEKIYQRQIFKHFLTSKILVDPKQQRFFKTNDLYELFTLGAKNKCKTDGTETGAIFAGTATEYNKNFFDAMEKKMKFKEKEKNRGKLNAEKDKLVLKSKPSAGNKPNDDEEDGEIFDKNIEVSLSEEKICQLREISKRMAAQKFDIVKEKKGKQNIPYLSKKKKFSTKEDSVEAPSTSKDQDDYVLRSLFKNSAVHAALGHDQIIGTSTSADLQLVEDEAEIVAKRAANLLKKSRRAHADFVRHAAISTRASGASKLQMLYRKRIAEQDENPRPDKKSNDCSSVGLLQAIYERNEQILEPSLHLNARDRTDELDYPSLQASYVAPFSVGDRFEKLADEMRAFIATQNGRVSTNDILIKFKDRVPPSDSFVFRAILRKLCRLLPNSQWVLRDEFV